MFNRNKINQLSYTLFIRYLLVHHFLFLLLLIPHQAINDTIKIGHDGLKYGMHSPYISRWRQQPVAPYISQLSIQFCETPTVLAGTILYFSYSTNSIYFHSSFPLPTNLPSQLLSSQIGIATFLRKKHTLLFTTINTSERLDQRTLRIVGASLSTDNKNTFVLRINLRKCNDQTHAKLKTSIYQIVSKTRNLISRGTLCFVIILLIQFLFLLLLLLRQIKRTNAKKQATMVNFFEQSLKKVRTYEYYQSLCNIFFLKQAMYMVSYILSCDKMTEMIVRSQYNVYFLSLASDLILE